jgi:hypothetical protein
VALSAGADYRVTKREKERKLAAIPSSPIKRVSFSARVRHVAYFVLLNVPERRFVARLYAKLGAVQTQAHFPRTPQATTSKSRYYSRTVYEFFAESFAQYVAEKRVPGEAQGLMDRVLARAEF